MLWKHRSPKRVHFVIKGILNVIFSSLNLSFSNQKSSSLNDSKQGSKIRFVFPDNRSAVYRGQLCACFGGSERCSDPQESQGVYATAAAFNLQIPAGSAPAPRPARGPPACRRRGTGVLAVLGISPPLLDPRKYRIVGTCVSRPGSCAFVPQLAYRNLDIFLVS